MGAVLQTEYSSAGGWGRKRAELEYIADSMLLLLARTTATLTNGTLQIRGSGTTASGPFGFVANVSQAGVIFSQQG